jgi:hypothetical protein
MDRRVQRHRNSKYSRPLAATPSRWACWGPTRRVLHYYAIGLRKQFIYWGHKFNIYFYYYFTWSPSKRSNHAPPMLPAARTSCSIPPPLNALIFCWLLHFNLLFDGHLRPWHNIFFIFFVVYFIAPNDDNTPPPRVPPRYRTLPNIPIRR